MPYRKEQFINNEIYHVVLRGIDGNLIFKDADDYYRGIFSIYEFNTTKPIEMRERRRIRLRLKRTSGSPSSVTSAIDERDSLVEIWSFCLMPNHIHLLLKQIKEDGITKFMRKVGTGYAKYFNKRYNRKGYFFQNRFRSVHIRDDNQLKIIFTYIHANPVSLIEPKWKELGIKDPEKVVEFLENYKWSSYQDYLGKKNFFSVTDRDFLLNIIGGPQLCKDFIDNWVKYKGEIRKLPKIVLE